METVIHHPISASLEELRAGARFCTGCGQVTFFDEEWKTFCPNCYLTKAKPAHCIDCGEGISEDRQRFLRDRNITSRKRYICVHCAMSPTMNVCKKCGLKHPTFWTDHQDHPSATITLLNND